MKTFKTPRGTELPLTNLKGKDYLMVAYRLVWFREENPTWTIRTERVDSSNDSCLFRAEILNDNGTLVASAHKREHKAHFSDMEEKAETGAIGRALAHCGYGTQFAPELHEDDRVVDSPLEAKTQLKGEQTVLLDEDLGNYVIRCGKKFKGKRLNEVPFDELWNYAEWLQRKSEEEKKPLHGDALEFIDKLRAISPPMFNDADKIPF